MSDCRENPTPWPEGTQVDEKRQRVVFVLEDDEGEEREYDLPFDWVLCPVCQGRGSHVNPAIDSQGLTAEDFADDPDFRNDYLSGVYDQVCNECHGRRVVPEVQCPALDDYRRSESEYRRERAAERRMGA